VGLSDVPADRLRAWVEASTSAQGVPLKVADPATVERVRALLTGGERRPGEARGACARDVARRGSEPPDGLNAVDVQALASRGDGGVDHDVVDDGLDDRGLAGEVEALPPLP